jgi:putative DNA primase/helicase
VRPTLQEIHALNALNNEITTTDTGNTKLFVRLFGEVIRFSPEMDQWYVWNETHWAPDVHDDVFELTEQVVRELRERAMRLPDEGNDSPRQAMLRHAAKTESEASRRRIVSMARSHPRIRISSDDINVPDDTVTCPNGVVNLNTGEIKEHDSSRLTTSCTAVPYEPDATSNLLDEYLETFMPDPTDQRLLFAVLGRALRSGNDTRSLPLFLGASTSGKSQLVGAVARILRGYCTTINASVFRGNLDDRPRPDLMRAVRSRIAFAHEAAQTWDMHGDHVKKLTGMDSIPVRTLYKDIVEIRPTFTPIIVANEMPRVKGADEALKRRLVVVKFAHSIPSSLVDPAKRRRFEEDSSTQAALLARIILGSRDSIDLANWSEQAVAAQAEAFDEVDHVGQFLNWMLEQGFLAKADGAGRDFAKASDLHTFYTYWIKKHGDRADRDSMMNLKAFGKSLRGRGWETMLAAGTRWVGWALTSSLPWL